MIRPTMRKLKCTNPRSVKNFLNKYKKLLVEHNLLEKMQLLEASATYPLKEQDQELYEELDSLRCKIVQEAEKKCHKQKAGQVAFSPTLQLMMSQKKAWSLLLKKAQGKKISSIYLDKTLQKAGLSTREKNMGRECIQEKLSSAYKIYYATKGNAASLREDFLHELAAAQEEVGASAGR
jgi:hypothetical protein